MTAPLLARWPGAARGVHRVDLPEFGATLDMAVMDVEAAIAGWEKADRSIFFLRWFRTGPAWQVVGAHATTDRNEGRRPPDPMAELRALRELARLLRRRRWRWPRRTG